jgi:hypothetical protein
MRHSKDDKCMTTLCALYFLSVAMTLVSNRHYSLSRMSPGIVPPQDGWSHPVFPCGRSSGLAIIAVSSGM